MIVRHLEELTASCDFMYTLEERGNSPYLILTSVQFICKNCQKSAYVDLTLVPVHELHIKCGVCDSPLFPIREEEFEQQLIPIPRSEDQNILEENRYNYYLKPLSDEENILKGGNN